MQTRRHRLATRIIPAVAVVLSIFAQLAPTGAHAVFSQAYIRLDRMKVSVDFTATTGMLVCAKPATVGTEAKLLISLPTSNVSDPAYTSVSPFTLNTTAANYTTNTTNIPAGSTAWPSIGAAATSVTSPANVITIASGDLTVGTLYCFNMVGTNTASSSVKNGATASASLPAFIETQTSGSVTVDRTAIAIAVLADDQIVVTAVVPPTFIFTLNGNTDTFSTNLDPASVKSTAGRIVTITTNAKGGWIAWARDTQQGLRSASAAYTIPTAGTVDATPSTLTAGTEGYVLAVTGVDASGGCTLTVDPEYVSSASGGGTLSANFQPIGSCGGSSPATANGDTLTLIERVAIAGATPAGTDYTDTITVVGAGNF